MSATARLAPVSLAYPAEPVASPGGFPHMPRGCARLPRHFPSRTQWATFPPRAVSLAYPGGSLRVPMGSPSVLGGEARPHDRGRVANLHVPLTHTTGDA